MTTIITTALMGLFVFSGFTGAPASPEPVEQELPHGPSYTVKMTAYNAVPAQTDSDPFTTASGAYSNPEVVAARSVDLADDLPFGTVIEITPKSSSPTCGVSVVKNQLGLRVIADSMHSRKRNQIDVLLDDEQTVQVGNKQVNPAIVLGICDEVEVHVVGHIDIAEIPDTQTELQAAVRAAVLAQK